MNKEMPALMRPPEPPEDDQTKQEGQGEVLETPDEGCQILKDQIEARYLTMSDAWWKSKDKPHCAKQALSDLALEWTKDKDFIRQGIRHPETRVKALGTVYTAQALSKGLYEAAHHSERPLSREEQLVIFLNDDVLSELASLEEEIRDEKSPYKDVPLGVVSGMLDSPVAQQRTRAEVWLMEHLPFMESNLEEKIENFSSGEDATTEAWQNLLLRTENKDNFQKAFEMFMEVWKRLGSTEWVTMNSTFFHPAFTTYSKPLEKRKDWIAMGLAKMYGLDGPETVARWSRDGSMGLSKKHGPSHQYRYADHLLALAYLEQEQPGAAKDLQKEFNISHFGRYSVSALLFQWENRNESKPYGVMMYPDADWNGAFFDVNSVMAEAMLKLRVGGYETRIVEAGSKFRAAKEMLTLEKRYGSSEQKMEFFILCGHGEPDKIEMGRLDPPRIGESHTKEQLSRTEFTLEDIRQSVSLKKGAFDRLLESGAPAILFSCSTGAESGIAQEISQKTRKEVIGPRTPTILGGLDVEFTPEGKPLLRPIYKMAGTGEDVDGMRYVSGQKQ